MVDALVLRGEEGRGQTTKSLGELSSEPSRGYPNGATHPGKARISLAEHISQRGQPGELKHLSTPRKRNQLRFS